MQQPGGVIDAQTVQALATAMASIAMAAVLVVGRIRQRVTPGGRSPATPAPGPAATPAPVPTTEFLLSELVTARQMLVVEREQRTLSESAQAARTKRLEDRVATLEDQLRTRDQLVAMLVEQLRQSGAPVPAQALRVVQRQVENSGAGTPDGVVRSWLADHFSMADLGLLASDALGIPPDTISGTDPGTYADALIHYARRRGQVDLLLRAAKAARPSVPAPFDTQT